MKYIVKFIWRERLINNGYKVIKVKGWRTFLIEDKWNRRQTVTFLFGKK